MAEDLLIVYRKHSGTDSRRNFMKLDIGSGNHRALTKKSRKFSVRTPKAVKLHVRVEEQQIAETYT